MSSIPSRDFVDWRTYVIPVLYVVSTFISMKITSTMQKKQTKKKQDGEELENKPDEENNELDVMNQASKNMTYMMPILAVSISLVAPLGLALYWLTNNILMIIERLSLNFIIKDEEEEKQNG